VWTVHTPDKGNQKVQEAKSRKNWAASTGLFGVVFRDDGGSSDRGRRYSIGATAASGAGC
jgi:hypothetical protein